MKQTSFYPEAGNRNPDTLCDGFLTREFLKYGAPGEVVAQDMDAPEMTVKKQLIQIMKMPGSDRHKVPQPLKDLAKAAANHQYANSPHAKDKIGIVIARRPDLELSGKGLIGDELHGHALPEGQVKQMRMFAFFYALLATQRCNFDMLKLSCNLALNDYTYTDIEPTFYQSGYASDDVEARLTNHGIVVDNSEAVPKSRAPEKSLLFLSSRVFHSAPANTDIDAENIGKPRWFIDFMYISTTKIERNMA